MELRILSLLLLFLVGFNVNAQKLANDSQTPLHMLQPVYSIPYGALSINSVKVKMDLVLKYLQTSTLTEVENSQTHVKIKNFNAIDENSQLVRGSFRLASYEWGVTYAAMVRSTETTGDSAYLKYATERISFLARVAPAFKKVLAADKKIDPQMRQILAPRALDDAGAVCAAMIKVSQASNDKKTCEALILNYMDYILNKEKRLSDGTFSRNRPFPNTVWLDDMYMSLPAIAQYSIYTGKNEYIHQAAQLVLNFASRMFVPEKNLFRHGWVENMNPHPSFFWGRANGWAILTLCEVLDVLPASDPLYPLVLSIYQRHAAGLASWQSGTGFWHQLLDRNDSYLETSATAIYTYALAHGINQGWLDGKAYGPVAQLGWNAVSTKISINGEVEGTCVGTGMGFDPAFYYARPVSNAAAHGYGPALLAGAEMIRLLKTQYPKMNDNAIQYYQTEQKTDKPIFSVE
ncbi:MAG TPA: glycoside hydrolase family 88 protein [Bacteroidales bacterium]|nr:glycoside hydrolase family 88 protein [Bacteroidales bacterium]